MPRVAGGDVEQTVQVAGGRTTLEGTLAIPAGARGVVLFAHGSGSSRHSPRARSSHVITTLEIEDDGEARNKLTRNVASVEEKIGRRLGRFERQTPAVSIAAVAGLTDAPV
jgi:hypothetical protein